jgi:hypothetical protein
MGRAADLFAPVGCRFGCAAKVSKDRKAQTKVVDFPASEPKKKKAEPVARANGRAAPFRGSSVTFGKETDAS